MNLVVNPIPSVPFPLSKGVRESVKGKGNYEKRGFTPLRRPRWGAGEGVEDKIVTLRG
jgi:hypothetical protein